MENIISKFIYLKHKTNLKCVAVVVGKKEQKQLIDKINITNYDMVQTFDTIDGTEIICSDKESFFGIVVSD